MDVIAVLQYNRQNYENRIAANQEKIKKYERAYETLSEFKRIAQQSQEDFHMINSDKKSVLSDVWMLKKNSITAQRYYDGIEKEFSGIGTKLVGGVYEVLLFSASSKLKEYLNILDSCESDIETCQKKISDIDKKIADLQRAQENADQ